MFWRRNDNRASVFVDYEYCYVSMKELYHTQLDLAGWRKQLREWYQVESLRFFGNYLNPNLSDEVTRIREASSDIIETNCDIGGDYMKDMSDVIILGALYRAAVQKRSPQTFVLFTGDGHFQPVVRYLVQDLGKRVELYGIQTTISRALRDTASETFEISEQDVNLLACFRYIAADFNRITLNHDKPFATFQRLISRVSRNNNVPKERVKMALAEMMNQGLITKKRYRVSYDKPMINVLVPEWEELIATGLHQP